MAKAAAATPSRRRSSATRGAYYKSKTRRWLVARGFQCGDLEKVHYIWTSGRRMATKRDQFGADLLAVSANRIVFIQVKGGQYARSSVAAARRTFDQYTFPTTVTRWIVLWPWRGRRPTIIESRARGEWKELSR